MDNRETYDDHSSDELAVFEKLALLLCNICISVTTPPGWEEATLHRNDNVNVELNQMWDTLDPNYSDDFAKVRRAKDV